MAYFSFSLYHLNNYGFPYSVIFFHIFCADPDSSPSIVRRIFSGSLLILWRHLPAAKGSSVFSSIMVYWHIPAPANFAYQHFQNFPQYFSAGTDNAAQSPCVLPPLPLLPSVRFRNTARSILLLAERRPLTIASA